MVDDLTRTSGMGERAVDAVDSSEAGVVTDPFDDFNRAMGADGANTPYPTFVEMRSAAHIHAEGMGYDALGESPALFTAYSYEAVHTILGDGETFSSAGYGEVMGEVMGRSILEMDEPEHRTYRSILQQAFTRKEMQRWETELVGPLVNQMVDEFIGDGHADLVRQLLFPFPVSVIAALLGLPAEDLPEFHRLAVQLIGVTVDWDRAVAASAQLREYFSHIVADRRAHPADDMISVLATAEQDGQRLTDEEIYAFLRLLLPAGAETTYRSSSNLMFGLLTHPDQLGAVIADRDLLPQAIEEGIRWEPPLLIIVRSATRDTEVCGVQIPAGSSLIMNLGSANHDDRRWPDAESFDIFRERRPHIGFAHGPHLCLGMHLARMETTVAVNTLLDRLPGLRLDPEAGEQYVSGNVFRAPPSLQVVWD
jgi:cytochrome P450